MTYQYHRNESSNPAHLPYLECPNCKAHSVVLQGESRYVCLRCGWSRDVSEWNFPVWLIFLLLGFALVLMLG